MKRWIFNIAAALSLLLCLATVALWVRSYLCETILVESKDGRVLLIGINGPWKMVHDSRDRQTLEEFVSILMRMPAYTLPNNAPAPGPRESGIVGFWFVRGDYGSVWSEVPGERTTQLFYAFWIVGLPYWFIVLVAAVPPAVFVVRQRRTARRRRSKACVNCGYDLRATPDRCPECGTVPIAKLP